MERHHCPHQKYSKPGLDRAGSASQLKPGRLFGRPGDASDDGKGKVQSRESTEEISQSSRRKVAHPRTASI